MLLVTSRSPTRQTVSVPCVSCMPMGAHLESAADPPTKPVRGHRHYCVMTEMVSCSYYTLSTCCMLAVLPHESVYGEFDASGPGLHVMVLHRNSHLTPRGGTIVYDTRGANITPADIAPCARIENFQDVTVYHAACSHKNAILKYKGHGTLEAREGTKAKIKKGFASMFMGKKSPASGTTDDAAAYTLDFATNVGPGDIDIIYSTNGMGGQGGG